MRFAANRRWVEQQFCAHQRHGASTFREPLVPADANADFGVGGVPDLKTGITRREIVFFAVTRAVRDVALTISAEVRAISINDCNAVLQAVTGALIETDGQHHLQLFGDFSEMRHRLIVFQRCGEF